ncbi:MAG TPA: ATP-binding protein [Vicinamibacterales bacterium]|nr:ATP-binding protein [Vicinamibacterales bacterium]
MTLAGPVVRPTIKTTLLLGFGLTLTIWLAAGLYFTRRLSDTESRAVAINTRYLRAQELLSSVRAQVLLGSVYVRDALLDPHPVAADYQRQLETAIDGIDRALQDYVPVLDTASERERVSRLQAEVENFRQTMIEVLATDSSQWPTQARTLLRTRVVPTRETVIRVSEEVQVLNSTAFVQQQKDVASIYNATQRGLWESLGLALLASFGIAMLAGRYAVRLEARLQDQLAEDAEKARQLHDLSAKLITAQEEERRTIARELHDEVGQLLTTIKVELVVAQRAIEAGGGNGMVLDDARSVAEGAVATVRDLSHLLHPALLDDLGLPATIEWYLRGFGRRHQIRAEVLHDRMDQRLAVELEASIYRIVQEALTNVAKHARAGLVRVYLQRLSTSVLVTIEDDGIGFDPAEIGHGAGSGLGLISIRERAKQLGGTVSLETAPGKGVRLTIEAPVRLRQKPIEPEFPADGSDVREAVAHG